MGQGNTVTGPGVHVHDFIDQTFKNVNVDNVTKVIKKVAYVVKVFIRVDSFAQFFEDHAGDQHGAVVQSITLQITHQSHKVNLVEGHFKITRRVETLVEIGYESVLW